MHPPVFQAQPIHMPDEPEYVWRTRGWGPCSKMCGGGKIVLRVDGRWTLDKTTLEHIT